MYNLVKNVSHLYRIYLKNCWFLIYPRSEQMKRVEFQKFLIVREITLSIKPNPLSYHTHISIIPASLKPAAGIKLFIRALHSPVPIHLYNDISNIIRPFIQQTGVEIVHTEGTEKKRGWNSAKYQALKVSLHIRGNYRCRESSRYLSKWFMSPYRVSISGPSDQKADRKRRKRARSKSRVSALYLKPLCICSIRGTIVFPDGWKGWIPPEKMKTEGIKASAHGP